jgi:carbon starvation protein CstA
MSRLQNHAIYALLALAGAGPLVGPPLAAQI